MSGLIGKKIGMTRLFSETGEHIPVSVIEAGPCFVTQVKTQEKDGYQAVQLGFEDVKDKNVAKPLKGHFQKASVTAKRVLVEFMPFANKEVQPGDEVGVDIFAEGEVVAISGTSKGRGFAGVMKRHNFSGAQITHGQSDRQRAPGSIGQSSYPSRVFKGMRMAGRMGNDRVTIKGLQVVKIDKENNLLFVKGSIPGARNGIVEIRK
jgi:large subunit ribosomal protein L3